MPISIGMDKEDVVHICNAILKWSEVKWSEVAQSCLTLCNPMDCSLPGSTVHGVFQARILEWIAISFSRGTSQTRDWTWVSRIVGRRFTVWGTIHIYNAIFSSVQSLSRVRLFATPWIAARQASLSITNSRCSPRLRSYESVMPSSHFLLCRPLLLLPPIPPSIRVFSFCLCFPLMCKGFCLFIYFYYSRGSINKDICWNVYQRVFCLHFPLKVL